MTLSGRAALAPTEGTQVSGITDRKRRTLWRTHSVVCRRCKAMSPNLSGKRTEMRNTVNNRSMCAVLSLGCAFYFVIT